jgi:carboxyl-terminal processing protease
VLRHLCALSVVCLLLVQSLAAADSEEPLPFPDMAPTLGKFIEQDYYDLDRVRPKVLVQHGLRALEAADIAIETDWKDGKLALTIGTDRNVLPAPDPASLVEAMRLLETVRLALDHPRFDSKRQRNLTYAMLNGALRSLDPHTVIFPPEPADLFAEDIEGEFFGIGAYLSQEDGMIRIDRVMAGLPADQAGVEDGDVILGVDGEKTIGLSLGQTVRRIKGPKGTKVVLTVERAGAPEPLDITITRDKVQIIVMRSYRRGDIGYVRMDEFNRQTAAMLIRELLALQQRGPLEAFVLDLRFNSGGLLSQAKIISDLFLPGDREIVRTVSPGEDGKPYLSSPRILMEVPMMVLTGSGSASAAEILAGSLQLNDRAVVAGATTFGKGSVQTIRSLRDESQLKITIQEYQLRGGVSIQERGVEPDLMLLRHSTTEGGVVDLIPYPLRREGDDEFALRDHGTYEHKVVYRMGWLESYRSRQDMKQHGIASPNFQPDQEAGMVLDLLAGAVALLDPAAVEQARKAGDLRSVLLAALKEPIAKRSEEEAGRLASALAQAPGIIWGDATAVASDQLKIVYDGPERITAGTDISMGFTITNTGDAAVGRLYGLLRADQASPFWEDEMAVGAIDAGASTTVSLPFKVPPRLYAGEERMRLELFVLGGKKPVAVLPLTVQVEAQPRPRLSYRWELVEGDDANGQIDLDENAIIRIHITNTGDGDSAPVVMYVFKDDDHFVQLGEGRIAVDAVPAGGSKAVDLPITVNGSVTVGRSTHRYSGDSVKLQLRAEEDFEDGIDGRYRASVFHALEVPIAAPFEAGSVVPPAIELLGVERLAEDRVRLQLGVGDDSLGYVSIFVDEDKIALYPAAELKDGRVVAEVPLAPGANSVRVVAADITDVLEVLPLRLWGAEKRVVAVAPELEPVAPLVPAPELIEIP